ncbi:hypothetical protein ATKI12_8213 [Kitasatospora sp. Ki12]
MRREPVTAETVARCREAARTDPATGLPALARALRGLAVRPGVRPGRAVRLMEEAADIYRALVADGAVEHLGPASSAVSSLAHAYSRTGAHDLALAARYEASDLARRAEEARPVADLGRAAVLRAELSHALAEAGRFDEAVDAARAVADRSRAVTGEGGSDLMWRLLDLTVLLRLAGRAEEAMAVEHAALEGEFLEGEAVVRRRGGQARRAPSPVTALRTAGAALWFDDLGHPARVHPLLAEAARAAENLPARGESGDFGFHEAVRAALFARSGGRDEQAAADSPEPLGVDPGQRLQPLLGVSIHHWSFGPRTSFEAGLGALVGAVEAITGRSERTAAARTPLPQDRDLLAALGTLTRRCDLRRAVLGERPHTYTRTTIPRLRRSVDIERRLHATDPAAGARRLVRALTDLAMAELVDNDNAAAAGTLHEAHALSATAPDVLPQRSPAEHVAEGRGRQTPRLDHDAPV